MHTSFLMMSTSCRDHLGQQFLVLRPLQRSQIGQKQPFHGISFFTMKVYGKPEQKKAQHVAKTPSYKELTKEQRILVYGMLFCHYKDGKLEYGCQKTIANHFKTSPTTIHNIWKKINSKIRDGKWPSLSIVYPQQKLRGRYAILIREALRNEIASLPPTARRSLRSLSDDLFKVAIILLREIQSVLLYCSAGWANRPSHLIRLAKINISLLYYFCLILICY